MVVLIVISPFLREAGSKRLDIEGRRHRANGPKGQGTDVSEVVEKEYESIESC